MNKAELKTRAQADVLKAAKKLRQSLFAPAAAIAAGFAPYIARQLARLRQIASSKLRPGKGKAACADTQTASCSRRSKDIGSSISR